MNESGNVLQLITAIRFRPVENDVLVAAAENFQLRRRTAKHGHEERTCVRIARRIRGCDLHGRLAHRKRTARRRADVEVGEQAIVRRTWGEIDDRRTCTRGSYREVCRTVDRWCFSVVYE